MSEPVAVACAGAVVIDRLLRLKAPHVPATSNPAVQTTSAGGVARNVAENLARFGVRVRLHSRTGPDEAGRQVLARTAEAGVDCSRVELVPQASTGEYLALLAPDGSLVTAAAAMDLLDLPWPPDAVLGWADGADWLFCDTNLPAAVLHQALDAARTGRLPARLAVDAVSTAKVRRLRGDDGRLDLRGVDLLFVNSDEAAALLEQPGTPETQARELVGRGAAAVVLTLGPEGAVLAEASGTRRTASRPVPVRDVTGAGDALVAATLAALAAGQCLADAVRAGTVAGALTVQVGGGVRPDLATALAGELARVLDVSADEPEAT